MRGLNSKRYISIIALNFVPAHWSVYHCLALTLKSSIKLWMSTPKSNILFYFISGFQGIKNGSLLSTGKFKQNNNEKVILNPWTLSKLRLKSRFLLVARCNCWFCSAEHDELIIRQSFDHSRLLIKVKLMGFQLEIYRPPKFSNVYSSIYHRWKPFD